MTNGAELSLRDAPDGGSVWLEIARLQSRIDRSLHGRDSVDCCAFSEMNREREEESRSTSAQHPHTQRQFMVHVSKQLQTQPSIVNESQREFSRFARLEA